MVLAPEHDLVEKLTTPDQKATVDEYLAYVNARSEVERMAEKKVSGAFIGAYAINPFTNEEIPIWIGEYVLKDYGTGAIMAVPSDDERDLTFAKKFGLKIIEVVDKTNYPDATLKDKLGVIINSGFLTGMEVPDAIKAAHKKVEEMGIGKAVANYKLRDANFSRQRYWGEPFPVTYDNEDIAHMLDLSELPLELPDTDDFKPGKGGKSPLARLTEWANPSTGYQRETDTMPAVAGSSWYFLRYMDPHNNDAFASQESVNYWQSVDLYVGGSEHAVAHLMYARFWHKFLYDKGLVPTNEPFKKLINQGMIQGVIEHILIKKDTTPAEFYSADLVDEADMDQYTKLFVHIDFVSDYGSSNPTYLNAEGIKKYCIWRKFDQATFYYKEGNAVVSSNGNTLNLKITGEEPKVYTISEVGKMSKSRYNVINPEEVTSAYGTDCFRMYEMFLGPIEQSKPWDTKGIDGVSKFLRKFIDLFYHQEKFSISEDNPTKEELKTLHATIKKVSGDIENFSFNTSVSSLMMCVNELRRLNTNKRAILEPLVALVAPFAPFLSEELWQLLGHSGSIHHTTFPQYQEEYLIEDTVTYPICINGKKRGEEVFAKDLPNQVMETFVRELDYVQKWAEGTQIKKVIVVPGRMINVVI